MAKKKKVTPKKVTPQSGGAYEACIKAHQGQAGTCDQQGNWHPAT